MALYVIGDLHLSLTSDKPMDVFGGGWENYLEKLSEGFKVLDENDTCVLCGDISWGMTLEESLEDFRFIDNLPGKKIVLKGNHDYWWTTVSKMKAFFESHGICSIDILHNNSYFRENAAICGTRGWLRDDSLTDDENNKIMDREIGRLRASLRAADATSPKDAERICFFHYPPRHQHTVCDGLISAMNDFGVTRCFYGHLHGHGHRLAVRGVTGGIKYDIISADYINFTPQKVENI